MHSSYNFRKETKIRSKNIHTFKYGTEEVSQIRPKIWNLLQNEWKMSTTLGEFEVKIKKKIPRTCSCRLSKTHIKHLGFV